MKLYKVTDITSEPLAEELEELRPLSPMRSSLAQWVMQILVVVWIQYLHLKLERLKHGLETQLFHLGYTCKRGLRAILSGRVSIEDRVVLDESNPNMDMRFAEPID